MQELILLVFRKPFQASELFGTSLEAILAMAGNQVQRNFWAVSNLSQTIVCPFKDQDNPYLIHPEFNLNVLSKKLSKVTVGQSSTYSKTISVNSNCMLKFFCSISDIQVDQDFLYKCDQDERARHEGTTEAEFKDLEDTEKQTVVPFKNHIQTENIYQKKWSSHGLLEPMQGPYFFYLDHDLEI